MRLLSSKEVREKKEQEQQKTLLKGLEVEKFITEQTRRLNQAKKKHVDEMEKLKEDLESFTKTILTEKDRLLSEISFLEQRKKSIEESSDEKHWQLRHEAIVDKEKTVLAFEESLNERTRLHESEVKRFEERLEELERFIVELDKREVQCREQEKRIADGIARLQEESEKVRSEREIFDTWTQQKVSEIENKEKELLDREKVVDVLTQEIKTQQQDIRNDRIALQDGYRNLARAREEILGRKI